MAIKSKNTDVFKGLVSWLCLMMTLCSVVLCVLFLLRVTVNPMAAQTVSNLLEYFEYYHEIPHSILLPGLCLFLLFILAILFAFLFRKDRRQFESSIARGLSHIWVEVKLIFLFSSFFLCLESGLPLEVIVLTIFFLLYFLCLDIGRNRFFFRCNVIRSILNALNNYRDMTSFEQRSIRRLFSCISVIVGVIGVSAIGFLLFLPTPYSPIRTFLLLAVSIFAATGVVGTISWYTLALKRDLQDWNILMAQIAEMYGGNLNAVNHIPPTSNLYDCAMQLNMIRTGIQKAVEEGTKADRTKVELITNVSHDIKTPLTSIIGYIELLKKEPDLPPHVTDYIQTISRKADRLSNIVQDVFEISKAATGNISLNLEDLDIGKLLQQTFGEMNETVQNSQLIWRIDIPEVPILIHGDGQRLYRVFQNLIRNCAQYSLEGSRVYVALTAQDNLAKVTIRNISRTEITMNGNDLTARFVRGDQNRTTEGSGLGLSIAKSFTEACNGSFFVHTENDLFTVTVQFPLVLKPATPPPFSPEPPSSEGMIPPPSAPLPSSAEPVGQNGMEYQKDNML